MKFLNLIKKLQKGSFNLLALLVGIGFVAFGVLPYVLPGTFTTDASPLVNVITVLIGAVAIFFALRGLKDVTGTTLQQSNYFDKVDTAAVDPRIIEEIRTSGEANMDYYFHFCGKLNQSYVLETPERDLVYEFNCDKIGLLKDFIFTFRNHLNGKEETHNISHTITTSYGDENFSLVDKSWFNIDGKNIWQYIADMGYSVEPYLDPVAWSFRIKHYGIEVAELKCAGTNILEKYEGKGGLRNVATMGGLYRVSCRQSDAEAVAIIAFAVSRVQII